MHRLREDKSKPRKFFFLAFHPGKGASAALCFLTAAVLFCVTVLYSLPWDSVSTAAGTDASSQKGVGVPVLMYHSLLKDSSYTGKYVIPPTLFASDLSWLKAHGYETILMQDLINYVDHGTPLPEKPIVITFDDGYYNNYLYGFPLLKQQNMKAVISIIGFYSDKYSALDENNAYYTHCTWPQINEMLASGLVEIQNHTYNLHTYNKGRLGCAKKAGESADAYHALLCGDVTQLQNRITEMTGTVPTTFTYPFGSFTKETRQIIRELGFRASLSCESGVSTVTRDPASLYMLKRYLRPAGKNSEQYFASVLSG
jgi:Predicted xylanase/chitin deacetylase